jgi:hypothetical protein
LTAAGCGDGEEPVAGPHPRCLCRRHGVAGTAGTRTPLGSTALRHMRRHRLQRHAADLWRPQPVRCRREPHQRVVRCVLASHGLVDGEIQRPGGSQLHISRSFAPRSWLKRHTRKAARRPVTYSTASTNWLVIRRHLRFRRATSRS